MSPREKIVTLAMTSEANTCRYLFYIQVPQPSVVCYCVGTFYFKIS